MSNENNSALDALLDASIDDLADLPEFAIFPAGLLRVVVNFESKTVNNHPSIEMKMKLVETVELANPAADQPLKEGTEASVLFMLDNEFGQGQAKAILSTFAQACGTNNMRDTMEAANGMEVQVVSKPRQNKDKTQSYTGVTKVII